VSALDFLFSDDVPDLLRKVTLFEWASFPPGLNRCTWVWSLCVVPRRPAPLGMKAAPSLSCRSFIPEERTMKSDSDLRHDVERELESDPSIDSRNIAVTAKNGL
jgi:hypothetical protein